HQVVKLTGTRGALWASWSGALDRDYHPQSSLKYHDGAMVVDVPLEGASGEVYELENEIGMMVRAVRDGTPVAATGADGRWAVALCLAAQQSAETGHVVSLTNSLKAE